jgi:hypothetical protein
MANVLLTETWRAGGVIRQFRGVTLGSADDTVVEISTLGTGKFIGICQEIADANDVTIGKRVVAVQTHGVSKAVAGAAITRGDSVACDAQGRVITAIATYNVIGVARQSVTTAGDILDVDIAPGGIF